MKQQDTSIHVIAIDGGAGTGKGTQRILLAKELGFNSLDSGVLYRALGFKAKNVIHDKASVIQIADSLNLKMKDEKVFIDGIDQTIAVRSDESGKLASIVAKIEEVRESFFHLQMNFRKPPGLVADGRDMGIIFDTPFRYFIMTDPQERARRRKLQFENMKISADYSQILEEIIRRDESDATNPIRPLRPHPEALIIDNTELSKEETSKLILSDYLSRR